MNGEDRGSLAINDHKKPLGGSDKSDLYTNAVMQSIDRQVFKTLNLQQLEAIYIAISGARRDQNGIHRVDLRGVIPLYLFRLYYVVLIGRDRRNYVRMLERQRAKGISAFSLLALLYCAGCGLFCTALFFVYIIKASLGIDFIANRHVFDILDF